MTSWKNFNNMEIKVLDFGKIKKAMPHSEWEKISADGAPPGVYCPNMSVEDMHKWKAKLVGGTDPRVEIRKTISGARLLL